MPDDPFLTGELRRRVLDAWADSPSRRTADANLEADYAQVGYRDRVVVELAQNASDAATRAGVPGHLRLELSGSVLVAANTGAPLDAAGVESIAVSRASAKTGQPGVVGRFGVGFGAVLSVSDEPAVRSATGAVRWSRDRARNLVDGDPVAVLRLPFPADGSPSPGMATEVVLPLRDAAADTEVRRQLSELDPTLLLSLPGLSRVTVGVDGNVRELTRATEGERVVLRDGGAASRWSVHPWPAPEGEGLWAVPVDDADRVVALPPGIPRVVRSPTAGDDPLTLGALLVAPYPLEATRRRVTSGPGADAVTQAAADGLLAAVLELPPHPSLGRLVPAGLPEGALDAALHTAVLARLREGPWLPVAADPELRQRARDAVAVADPLVDVLREVIPTLLPAGWPAEPLNLLGVRRPAISELVEVLGPVTAEPAWWRRLYAALDATLPPGPGRDDLGALPVPLTDGTTVTGPRGVAVTGAAVPDADLSGLGIRLVHPEAAHPLLLSLGAREAGPRELLDQPRVRAAVDGSYDADDPGVTARAVLSLVSAGRLAPGELPWLGDLALLDDTGEWRPAAELLLPAGRLAGWVAADSAFGVVAPALVAEWAEETLRGVGVLDDLVLLRVDDALGPDHDLDDEEGWWAQLPAGAAVPALVAVRDLEQIRDEAWPAVVAAMAEPPLREAVVDPAVVLLPDGRRTEVPSYTAWWLSTRPVVDGQMPRRLRLTDADGPLAGLYAAAPPVADAEFLRALGVLTGIEDADPQDVLDRLADPAVRLDRAALRLVDRWLAGRTVRAPSHVRALRDGKPVVVPAADAVVVDAPDLTPLLGGRALVPVPLSQAVDLAETLDLALATELAEFAVVSSGTGSGEAVVHDRLVVTDADGRDTEVRWRLVGDTLHVDARQQAFGLGRGTAWRDGRWAARHRLSEEWGDPAGGRLRADENDLDEE